MALTIPINLNIENLAELNAQVAKMAGAAGGAGAGAAGRGPGAIGSLFGGEGGAGGSTAKGLGQIAKQLPGAGVLSDMGGAFKSGGIIGVGMAGVAGILGFVKQIVESSKVFQGIAGSFFKIFGAMADMFLLPFLPLAMRGMQMLMQHLPRFQEWGQKAADWIGQLISDIQSGGFWNTLRPLMARFENWLATDFLDGLALAVKVSAKTIGKDIISVQKPTEIDKETGEITGGGTDWMATIEKVGNIADRLNPSTGGPAKGRLTQWIHGKAPWLPGDAGVVGEQFSPTIKRGDQVAGLGAIEEGVGSIMNSMEVSLARQADKVKNYASEFSQKETGAGGALAVWDDEVLRGAIPDTWDSIDGMYRTMNDELTDEARNAETLKGGLVVPAIDLGAPIKKTQEEIERALKELSTITLSKFVLDPSVANDIENCFIMANQCLNTKFTSLSDLVEGGVEHIQAGVGGNIFNLAGINALVSSAAGMGGAIETEAARIAQQVALMTQQLATEGMDLTVDPKALAAEIRQLQQTIDAKVLSSANTIAAATANVNGLVDQWAHMANDWMDPSLGYGEQFGVLGAEYGEATGRAGRLFGKMKRWKIKRKKQVRLGSSIDTAADDAVADIPVIEDAEDQEPDEDVYEPGPFEEAWGITEEAVRDIQRDMHASEESFDMFDAYQEQRSDDVHGTAGSSTPTGPTGHMETMNSILTEQAIIAEQAAATYDDWSYGEQFGAAGGRGGGRRGVQNTSHSVMNISINTRASVQDILSDLRRIQHMDDASFFNSVS